MEKFTLSGSELQKWYDHGKAPNGYDHLELNDCIETDSGDFDGEKGAMMNYEIFIEDPKTNEIWRGIGGYYTSVTGHQFNHSITFEKYSQYTWDDINKFLKQHKAELTDNQLELLKRNFTVPENFGF